MWFSGVGVLQADDRRPAATALQLAWQQMEALHGSSSSSRGSLAAMAAADAVAAAAASQRVGPLLSQQQLSDLLVQELGYSVSVRPSLVGHQEAGESAAAAAAAAAAAGTHPLQPSRVHKIQLLLPVSTWPSGMGGGGSVQP
jgi:hypothetical protein